MSTEIAIANEPSSRNSELAVRPGAYIVADALLRETEQRKLLGQYVSHHMIPGTDFGVIPGTEKPTLYKPGAEKLTQLFRCIPRFRIEDRTENWETGLFYYRIGCTIVTQGDGTPVAEGVGSCSTFESRYRWRNASRVCPSCGKEAIIKGKTEFGGGWVCFKKKDGCGAKFNEQDKSITSQAVGRIENPDIRDHVNTVLKMAKKRALVDAAIALARCSDIFTQDLEDNLDKDDLDEPKNTPPVQNEAEKPAANAKPAQTKSSTTLDSLRTKIAAASTIEELGKVWSGITPADQKALVADKEAKKAAIQQAAQKAVQPAPEQHRPEPPPPKMPDGSLPQAVEEQYDPDEDTSGDEQDPANPFPPETMPSAERRMEPPADHLIGPALQKRIAALFGDATGLDWPTIRDGVEAAHGWPEACGYVPRLDLKLPALTATAGMNLLKKLEAVKAEKDKRKRKKPEPAEVGAA